MSSILLAIDVVCDVQNLARSAESTRIACVASGPSRRSIETMSESPVPDERDCDEEKSIGCPTAISAAEEARQVDSTERSHAETDVRMIALANELSVPFGAK